MARKEYTFTTSLQWQGDGRATASAPDRPEIEMAVPSEFGGPGDAWSPEDLLPAALESCVMMTFLYEAERADIELLEYRSETEAVLEKQSGGMSFTRFTVRPEIKVGPGDGEEARQAVERATQSCFVHRSLKGKVSVKATVRSAGS